MMRCSDNLPQSSLTLLTLMFFADFDENIVVLWYSERLFVLELYYNDEIDPFFKSDRIAAFSSAANIQSGVKPVEGGDIRPLQPRNKFISLQDEGSA